MYPKQSQPPLWDIFRTWIRVNESLFLLYQLSSLYSCQPRAGEGCSLSWPLTVPTSMPEPSPGVQGSRGMQVSLLRILRWGWPWSPAKGWVGRAGLAQGASGQRAGGWIHTRLGGLGLGQTHTWAKTSGPECTLQGSTRLPLQSTNAVIKFKKLQYSECHVLNLLLGPCASTGPGSQESSLPYSANQQINSFQKARS